MAEETKFYTNPDFIARSPFTVQLDDSLLFEYCLGEATKPSVPR